ncbi:thioredoxin family protein [Candidatus Nomurabacteria bacterium]|nr:thioredoxin family protein [Candidatus Nomurabacteria bacterium]
MNKNIGIIIGVVALIVLLGGFYVSKNDKDPVVTSGETKNVVVTDTKAEDTTTLEAGTYETYAPEKVALASATHDVVLFFRASWCPTCIAVDKDIKANLGKIPASLTILDVNYDNSSDLKKKYGVTYQHTFVQVDKDGNMLKKWSGSPTLASLVTEVK